MKFPNLIKDMILHIYEFQQTPSRINWVPPQDTMKLLKDRKNKEEILKASRETVAHHITREASTKLAASVSPETMLVSRHWNGEVLKFKDCLNISYKKWGRYKDDVPDKTVS